MFTLTYKLAKERNYPQGVKPLKNADGTVKKGRDGKGIPSRGPYWFISEDGHETWWSLDKQRVLREIDRLNNK